MSYHRWRSNKRNGMVPRSPIFDQHQRPLSRQPPLGARGNMDRLGFPAMAAFTSSNLASERPLSEPVQPPPGPGSAAHSPEPLANRTAVSPWCRNWFDRHRCGGAGASHLVRRRERPLPQVRFHRVAGPSLAGFHGLGTKGATFFKILPPCQCARSADTPGSWFTGTSVGIGHPLAAVITAT
jgi:hypothetical protein